MRTTRIYLNTIVTPGETLTLPASASNHLVRVLRCRKNSAVSLFNGQGGEFSATLLDEDPRSASVFINGYNDRNNQSPLNITLIQGLSRSEHMETTIQKATELGVSEIIPVFCERSSHLKKDRSSKKHERWHQIVISACEQSGRNFLPRLHRATGLENVINETAARTKLVLDPTAANSIKNIAPAGSSICILSGPEGGLSEHEMSMSADAGYNRVSFGPRILRTETAAPAIISALQTLWGDMG